MRIHFRMDDSKTYFHSLRVPGRRLFNNVLISVKTPEEAFDSLKAIAESFNIAMSVNGRNLPVLNVRLSRRKSAKHPTCLKISIGGGHTADNLHCSIGDSAVTNGIAKGPNNKDFYESASQNVGIPMPHRAATALRQTLTDFRDRVLYRFYPLMV